MVKVKKKDGRTEEFMVSKIVSGCEKAGSNAEQALCVATEILKNVADKTIVTAKDLSDMVVKELSEVNEAAAEAFDEYRHAKVRAGQA